MPSARKAPARESFGRGVTVSTGGIGGGAWFVAARATAVALAMRTESARALSMRERAIAGRGLTTPVSPGSHAAKSRSESTFTT